jgi:hypothetical protein
MGDYDLENAKRFAYFVSHASNRALYQDWVSIRSWFGSQTPAIQAVLLKARVWYQNGARRMARANGDLTTFGSLVLHDLNTGTVVLATHVDHSDC